MRTLKVALSCHLVGCRDPRPTVLCTSVPLPAEHLTAGDFILTMNLYGPYDDRAVIEGI